MDEEFETQWINKGSFKFLLLNSYVNSKRKILGSIFLPIIILTFLMILRWKARGYSGNLFAIISEEPLILTPFIMLLFMLYFFKPINNYLSFRQHFYFNKSNVKIEKYFKNYVSFNGEIYINYSDIEKIFDISDDGITLYLDVANQVVLPFVSGEEKKYLLDLFNPNGKIKIIKQ